MPVQLVGWERRDNASQEALGNAALTACRAWRAREGIRSARFYWYLTDTVVLWIEGEAAGLDAPGDADMSRASFALSDLARPILYWRLTDPRAGQESYRRAGR